MSHFIILGPFEYKEFCLYKGRMTGEIDGLISVPAPEIQVANTPGTFPPLQ